MFDLMRYFNTGHSYSMSTPDGINNVLRGTQYFDNFEVSYSATNLTTILDFDMDADTIVFTGGDDLDLSIVTIPMDGDSIWGTAWDNTDPVHVEQFMWDLVGDWIQAETPGDEGLFLIADADSTSCVRLEDLDSNGYYTADEYSVVFDVEDIIDVSGLADLVLM